MKMLIKEIEFDNLPIQKIDALIDKSIRGFHEKYFNTFDHICEFNLNFTNTSNNETVNFTISDKSIRVCELSQKLTKARGNGFIFNQIKNFKMKFHSNLSHINIHYYLTLRTPTMHCHFFGKLAENREYIQTFCNDRRNLFHFACRQRYSYNNPQC